MPPRAAPKVVLLSTPGTLTGVDSLLQKAGVRLVRMVSLTIHPVKPAVWLNRLPRSVTPDAVVVTSRAGVSAGVVPWLEYATPRNGAVQYWAAGPGTAAALRGAGIRNIRRPRPAGTTGILQALRMEPPRSVLYFRSDEAGPGLSRQLRRQGHAVLDLVVYRLGTPPPLGREDRRAILQANLLVVTSPSSLSNLRRRLDARTFRRLRHAGRLVVLGERSRHAAQGHGFRRISVAPSATAQGFTRYLLRELRDAGA